MKPKTNHLIQLRSGNGPGPCVECLVKLQDKEKPQHIADAINHYIDHGYQLYAITTETTLEDDGKLWSHSVAFLQKT